MRFATLPGPPADAVSAAGIEPASTWISVEDAELPAPLRLRLGVSDDHRLVCTGLLIDTPDREITARDLRHIRLAEILTTLIRRAPRDPELRLLVAHLYTGAMVADPGSGAGVDQLVDTMTRMQAVAERRPGRVRRARPGRRGYPDDHYREVAKAYRQAKRQHPRAPVRALMEELHVSEPTAHRWLRTATAKGFLSERDR